MTRRVTFWVAMCVTLLFLAVPEVEPMVYLVIAAWCIHALTLVEGKR